MTDDLKPEPQKTPDELDVCMWHYDDDYAYYETDCGGTYEFMNLCTYQENRFEYCPFCGGRITEPMPGE